MNTEEKQHVAERRHRSSNGKARLGGDDAGGEIPGEKTMKRKALARHLADLGVSPEILEAFRAVPRERFVAAAYHERAYEDIALPLGEGQTISQPYTIAFMLALLGVHDGQKILEIGSGSGYVLALLATMNPSGTMYGIEIGERLAEQAQKTLREWPTVTVVHGNGFEGLPGHGPYDRILVSAAARETPYHLLEQLREPGVLVVPVGTSLVQITKSNGKAVEKNFPGFAFVPLREKENL